MPILNIIGNNILGSIPGLGITSNWILATGFWRDTGVWDDSAAWID